MTQYLVLASEGWQRYIYTKTPKKYIGKNREKKINKIYLVQGEVIVFF
jgi:hypothetical protein